VNKTLFSNFNFKKFQFNPLLDRAFDIDTKVTEDKKKLEEAESESKRLEELARNYEVFILIS
jgi:hypothetical protein